MYGTIGKFKLKPGTLDAALVLFDEWERDYKPKIDGAQAGYTYQLDSDPNTIVIVAVFRDKDSYVANADNPDQDKWFGRFAELLDGEPEWNDGQILRSS